MVRDVYRCAILTIAVWALWIIAIFLLGDAQGLSSINKSTLDIIAEYTTRPFLIDVLAFTLAQLMLFAFMTWLSAGVATGIRHMGGGEGWRVSILGVLLIVGTIHLINSTWYPLSATAFPITPKIGSILIPTLAIITATFVIASCLKDKTFRYISAIIIILIAAVWPSTDQHDSTPSSNNDKANIIIIGIDALRPTELAFFGNENSAMPFLDSLLTHAEVFENSYTPAARTHPAWISILSGKYPYNNGVRDNLPQDHWINKEQLITRDVKKAGYKTIWAIDERRFNNIDETYGFDKVVGPKLGAADLLITHLSDIPITNILSNTKLAKHILPYVYINRGNYITYSPYEFNDEIIRTIDSAHPVFMSIHLTLPHYPFLSNLMRVLGMNADKPTAYRNYLSMLDLADRQLQDLFKRLRESGHLNNSYIYIISDHGEGFPDVDAGLSNGNPFSQFDVDYYGHGTNVLTLKQFQILISRMRIINGQVVNAPLRTKLLTSLIDLAPSITKDIGIKADYSYDGYPLFEAPDNRYVIMESSLSTDAINSDRLDKMRLLDQTVGVYHVSADGRLLMNDEAYVEIQKSKQRALIGEKNIMVALFPDETESAFIVDIENNIWWPSEGHVPLDVSWHYHLSELCSFFYTDPSFTPGHLCGPSATTDDGEIRHQRTEYSPPVRDSSSYGKSN